MKSFSLLLFLLTGAVLSAAPVAEKVSRTYHRHHKNYGKGEYISISNKTDQYLVYLQWINPTAKKEGKVVIGIPEPNFWQQFVNRDFMRLTINGFSSTELEPKDIKVFNGKEQSGVDILYNFDGVRMILRFYMREDSRQLFMEWFKDPSCKEKIHSAELALSAYPSMVLNNRGKASTRYQRAIKTPAREINSPRKTAWVKLTKEDSYLVMYDKNLNPSQEPKAKGPCLLTVNWNGIRSGKVWFGNIYCMNFRFTLNPDAPRWQFGLWEYKKSIDNQSFFNMFSGGKKSKQHF